MMLCMGCGAVLATEDNFCRYCGLSQRRLGLPAAVRELVPMVWRPPTLWRGIAALVLGTFVEIVRREVVRRANGREWPPDVHPTPPADNHQVLDEVIIVRRWRR
jgi:hypothetical protein